MKHLSEKIQNTPIFLIGEFSPQEITKYRERHVEAFLSKKLNPRALVERLHTFFELPLINRQKKTPML
ncbi:MAG: hypothetical protein ACLFR1_09045 [Spirochaetia bacterium]